ncbi:MAG: nuclease-related domain-containing protein [Chloroflexi bacterium]|nr:nuclease-related domain-containing protein [Chloroflexota bacterium]
MQNVAPTRSLNRRSRDLLMAAALIFLLGAALAVLGIALHVFSLVVPFHQGYAIYDLTRKTLLGIGIAVALLAIALALRAVTWKTDNRNAWQLGEMLAAHLDHRYVFIRNISKRTTGYIDAALVSRHGVLALRISKRKGEFFNEGGQWLKRRRKGNWRPMRWNPTREIVADAIKLRTHFKDCDMTEVPVYAAIVFLRDAPEISLKLQQPAVPVVHASQLIAGLRDGYFAEDRLSARAVQAAVNALYH